MTDNIRQRFRSFGLLYDGIWGWIFRCAKMARIGPVKLSMAIVAQNPVLPTFDAVFLLSITSWWESLFVITAPIPRSKYIENAQYDKTNEYNPNPSTPMILTANVVKMRFFNVIERFAMTLKILSFRLKRSSDKIREKTTFLNLSGLVNLDFYIFICMV